MAVTGRKGPLGPVRPAHAGRTTHDRRRALGLPAGGECRI